MTGKIRDPYKVLGLSHDATKSQIKSAYRKLALQCHPDRLNTLKTDQDRIAATNRFAEISSAYALLSDERRKSQYDHIYKYGGFDDDEDKTDNAKTSNSRRRSGSNGRGGRIPRDDPMFFKGTTSAGGSRRSDPIAKLVFRSGKAPTIYVAGRGGRAFTFAFAVPGHKKNGGNKVGTSFSVEENEKGSNYNDGKKERKTDEAVPWYQDMWDCAQHRWNSVQHKLSMCNTTCAPFLVQ